jgi:hypothetical protein
MALLRPCLFLGVFILASGCGSRSETCPVSGKISLDGVPIASGEVMLVPMESTGGGPVAADIHDGEFALQAPQGPKRVEVRAVRPIPGKNTPMGPIQEQYIPARYNAESVLRAEVTRDGPNWIELDLKSGGSQKRSQGLRESHGRLLR